MKVLYGRRMDDRLMPSDSICVAQSRIPNAGRGVFAADGIKKSEVIERCPVIEMMEPDIRARLHEMSLCNYYFTWGEEPGPGGGGAREWVFFHPPPSPHPRH